MNVAKGDSKGLIALTPEMDYDQMAMGLPPVTSAFIHLVSFYDIHGRKREVLFFYSVPDTTRDDIVYKY
jgi:hypothetical protein